MEPRPLSDEVKELKDPRIPPLGLDDAPEEGRAEVGSPRGMRVATLGKLTMLDMKSWVASLNCRRVQLYIRTPE